MRRVWIEDRQEHTGYRERAAAARKAKRTPPGRWRVRYIDPAGTERQETYQRESEAQDRRAELEVQLARGSYRDPRRGRVPFAEVAEAWLSSKHNVKRSTFNGYRTFLDLYILPRWGTTAVAEIRRDDVVAWVAELVNGVGARGWQLSASQVHQIVNVFSMALGFAVRSGRIAVNPAEGVELPRITPEDHVYLDHHQVETLAKAAGDYRVFVLLLAYTGLRYGEAAAITGGRVDLKRRRIRIAAAFARERGAVYLDTPKTHERRTVPVPAFLVRELRPLVTAAGAEGYVFTAPGGGPLRYDNVRRRVFDPAVASAGLAEAGVTIHKLRHTAASLAIAAGADVKIVQTMLGHKTAKMTLDLYGHLFPDRLDDVAERLADGRAAALRKDGGKGRVRDADGRCRTCGASRKAGHAPDCKHRRKGDK